MTASNARRDLFIVFLMFVRPGNLVYAGKAFALARESDSDIS